jgi:hypothetical protein
MPGNGEQTVNLLLLENKPIFNPKHRRRNDAIEDLKIACGQNGGTPQ